MYVLASCVLAAGLLITGQLGRWPGLLLGVAALAGLMLGGYERGGAAVGRGPGLQGLARRAKHLRWQHARNGEGLTLPTRDLARGKPQNCISRVPCVQVRSHMTLRDGTGLGPANILDAI